MIEPIPPRSSVETTKIRLQEQYTSKKDEYLELCWHYNLPPRDMSLFLMGKRDIQANDRIRLIRLIVHLVSLERILGPDNVQDFLFPEDESQYFNSAIFQANLH